MADEDKWSLDPGVVKESRNLGRSVGTGRYWPRIAPRSSGNVIGADSGQLPDLRLDQIPIEGEAANPDDRRTPVTGAVEMDTTAPDIY